MCSRVDLMLLNRSIGIINFERLFFHILSPTQLIVVKFNVGLKSFMHKELPEPEFYGDLQV